MLKRALPLLVLLLVLITSIAAVSVPADEDVHTRFSFAEKPVALVLITDDQEIVNYSPTEKNDPREEGERFVKVMFNVKENPFTRQEMKDLGKACTLTDSQGETYTSSVYTNVTLLWNTSKISLSDKQEQFGLIFCVPEGVALDTLTLAINGVEDTIPLSGFGEANFPAPTATPTVTEAPEATATPEA